MSPEVVKQVSEIVKNINVGFDGKLNSETLVALAEKIMPYFYMVQIKCLVVSILWAVAVVVFSIKIGHAVCKILKEAEKE